MEESMVMHSSHEKLEQENGESKSVGFYLASRLRSFGVTHFFTVPGDYTMSLLDEMIGAEGLQFVSCCNELNAGYAADGFARVSGTIGVIVVTYMVGALSAINAIAGANASDLPILVVCGAPNSNEKRIVHHSLGDGDITHGMRSFESVASACFDVRDISKAQKHIDEAIFCCWQTKKPVYLEISCDLSSQAVGDYFKIKDKSVFLELHSSQESLEASIQDASQRIKNAYKVVSLIGSKVLKGCSQQNLSDFLSQISTPYAILPDGKGLVDETLENYLGCYWGSTSIPKTLQELVESSDLLIVIGPYFSDYTTAGWTLQLPEEKCIFIAPDHVHICGKRYSYVDMEKFLLGIMHLQIKKGNFAKELKKQLTSEPRKELDLDHPLTLEFLTNELTNFIQENTACVLVDTGDCWFIGHHLKLAKDTKFCIQMRYGSIGWSVGAALGAAVHFRTIGSNARVLLLVGDGAFQVSAQELTTMIKLELNVTIIVVNNSSYNIEDQIHQGPYNQLVRWKYADFVEIVKGNSTKAAGFFVDSKKALRNSLQKTHNAQGVFLLDCILDPEDCTHELRVWGEFISEYNSRKE